MNFTKLVILFSRFFVNFYYGSGLYVLWTHIYRFIWEYKRTPMQQFEHIEALANHISKLKWRPDTWKELWDATSHPEHVQWIANNDPNLLIGDCEDFAFYIATAVDTQLSCVGCCNNWKYIGADILTTMWYSPKTDENNRWSVGGHAVALLKNADGTFSYMDYGMPSFSRNTIKEVMNDVLSAYAPDSTLLAYAVHDIHLNLLERHNG